MPLLVMLHGCRQDPIQFAEGTRMNALAEERGCAVLYPEQSTHWNPIGCWNWYESASLAGQGEAGFVAGLIEKIAARRSIDARRVSVVGMSAGGAMACLLATRYSRLFAACAIHSGLLCGVARSVLTAVSAMKLGPSVAAINRAQQQLRETRQPAVAVPTLVLHGDSDGTVNPANADHTIEQLRIWAQYLDPRTSLVLPSDEEVGESGGRRYRQRDYWQGGQLLLRKVVIEGLGHAWSGGDSRHRFNDAKGLDASRHILDFALRYKRA